MSDYLLPFILGAVLSFSLLRYFVAPEPESGVHNGPAVEDVVSAIADRAGDSPPLIMERLQTANAGAGPFDLLSQYVADGANEAEFIPFYELLLSRFEIRGEAKRDFAMQTALFLFGSHPALALAWAAQQPKELQASIYADGVRSALDLRPLSDVINLSKHVDWKFLPAGSIANMIGGKQGIDFAIDWIESNAATRSLAASEISNFLGEQLKSNKASLFLLDNDLISRLQPDVIGPALAREAQQSPAKALDWLDALSDSELRAALYPDLIMQIAEDDVDLALEHAGKLDDQKLVSAIAEGWARQDWEAAYRWYTSTGAMDDEGLQRLFEQGARVGTFEVAENLGNVLRSRPELNGVLSVTARRFTSELYDREPKETETWISSLPDGEVRDLATTRFADHLAYDDPRAASEWLRTMNSIPDSAIVELVGQIEGDLPGALAWISAVNDKQLQMSLAEKITSDWYRFDSTLTLQKLQESALDEETQRLLRSSFTRE